MSLDVYLKMEGANRPSGSGIYIRENGARREVSREEWNERFPDGEPVILNDDGEEKCFDEPVYDANITHNLGQMALEAHLYIPLWRPEENGITKAAELIPLLEEGLALLKSNPEHYKKWNPENGWGDYDGLVSFTEQYLKACRDWPNATVSVSR